MSFWMILCIWMFTFNVILSVAYAKTSRRDDDDFSDVLAKIVGYAFVITFLWPSIFIDKAMDKKKSKKKESRKYDKESIGFKTRAELQEIEARKRA